MVSSVNRHLLHTWKLQVSVSGKISLQLQIFKSGVMPPKKPYSSPCSWDLGVGCGFNCLVGKQTSASSIGGLDSVQMGHCITLGPQQCLISPNYLCCFPCVFKMLTDIVEDDWTVRMGRAWSSGSSCDEVCGVCVIWLACPVPFCFWRLCVKDFAQPPLLLLICLSDTIACYHGDIYSQRKRMMLEDWTALVNLFKKTCQASTVLSGVSRVFLPCAVSVLKAALWQGETWRVFEILFYFQLNPSHAELFVMLERQ